MSSSNSSDLDIFDRDSADLKEDPKEDPKRKADDLEALDLDFFNMSQISPKKAPPKAPPKAPSKAPSKAKRAKTNVVTIYTQFEQLLRCLVFDVVFYDLFIQIKDQKDHPLYEEAMKWAARRDKIKENLRDHLQPVLTLIADKSPDTMRAVYDFLKEDPHQEMHLFKKPDESGGAFTDPWTGARFEDGPSKDIHAMCVINADNTFTSVYTDRRANHLINYYHAVAHFTDYVYASIRELVPKEHYVSEYTDEAFDEAWARIVGEKCRDTSVKKWTMPKGADKNPLIVRLVTFRKFLEKTEKLL